MSFKTRNGMGNKAARIDGYVPPLPFDNLTNAPLLTYSVRRLRTAYIGPLLRVRRSSDGLEQDIGYDANNELDVAALASFVGAGNGTVSVWYDQSGNARNAIQSTVSIQPSIIISGVLQTINGKPAIVKTPGVNSYILSTFSPALAYSNGLLMTVVNARNAGTTGTIAEARQTTNNNPLHNLVVNASGIICQTRNDAGTIATTGAGPALNNNGHIDSAAWGTTSAGSGVLRWQDTIQRASIIGTGVRTFDRVALFTNGNSLGAIIFDGKISELYCSVDAAYSNADRISIEGSQGSYYNISPNSPPVSTVAPALTPTSGFIGTTITCNTGTWTGFPTPAYTYQWQRNTVDISGATANTFTPAYPADNGASIRCVVTATNSQGSASANSNAVTIETYTAPSNTVAPAASPTGGLIGTNITTNNGTWSGNPAPTFTYQLQRNAVDVAGQTTNSYTPVYPADNGASMRWRVTATNVVGSASANSNAITIETYTSPANTVAPVVSGSGLIGSALSVTNGTWTGNPAPTFTRQWRRNGSNISGATGTTYTPSYPADNGVVIDCVVTGTNPVGAVSQASSNSITVETYTAPNFTVNPAASPTGGLIGTAITCNNGTVTANPAPTYTYQWQRNTVNISGATSSSYTPAYPADNGANIRCVVTATNVVSAVSANSNNIVIETYTAPVNTVQPVISGTGVVGSAITTNNGTWTGNPAPTYTYQALKNGSNIAGATSSSYTPNGGDVGGIITYRVTATNVAGSANAVSSNSITVTGGGASADAASIILYGIVAQYNIDAFIDTTGYTSAEVTALGGVLGDG